jgi:urease accessory protein
MRMITVTKIVGAASEPSIADRLHRLAHDDRVEFLIVDRDDVQRRRLRARTEKGTDLAIALGGSERLADGSVLFLDEERAIVLRVNQERWLRIKPRNTDAALELGYCAGNHHWRVRYEPGALLVSLQGPVEDYLSGLDLLLKQRRIEWTCDE